MPALHCENLGFLEENPQKCRGHIRPPAYFAKIAIYVFLPVWLSQASRSLLWLLESLPVSTDFKGQFALWLKFFNVWEKSFIFWKSLRKVIDSQFFSVFLLTPSTVMKASKIFTCQPEVLNLNFKTESLYCLGSHVWKKIQIIYSIFMFWI